MSSATDASIESIPMSSAADDFPLEAQLDKLRRILGDRAKLYRMAVKKGQKSLDDAARLHNECRRIEASFAFLASNADWIRDAYATRKEAAQRDAEIKELRKHPAVMAVMQEFPGSEIADIRAIVETETTEE